MPSVIKATSTGLQASQDTSGSLQIQTNGSTPALTLNSNGVITCNGTGALALPSGTTAQRPVSPVACSLRYNTTISAIEVYLGGSWVTLP